MIINILVFWEHIGQFEWQFLRNVMNLSNTFFILLLLGHWLVLHTHEKNRNSKSQSFQSLEWCIHNLFDLEFQVCYWWPESHPWCSTPVSIVSLNYPDFYLWVLFCLLLFFLSLIRISSWWVLGNSKAFYFVDSILANIVTCFLFLFLFFLGWTGWVPGKGWF